MLPQSVASPANSGDNPVSVRAGIGLKPQHFQQILDMLPEVGWFELHPENYLVAGGPMLHYLGRIREHYPISFHSVGMSLGSVDGIDETHINRLKSLAERFQPAMISDHLSWSRWRQTALNDLLPMPYTRQALQIMADNIHRVQDILGRAIAIENPSSYFNIPVTDMDEAEFLVALATTTGASILLDVNNVFVSACNHGWSATDYINQIPRHLVSEIHLAGHKVQHTAHGDIRIDDHGSRISDEVWGLYVHTMKLLGGRPTLIEWDTDVPALSVLLAEAEAADSILAYVADMETAMTAALSIGNPHA